MLHAARRTCVRTCTCVQAKIAPTIVRCDKSASTLARPAAVPQRPSIMWV